MNFSFFIAKRYFLNLIRVSLINVISYISLIGVTVVTASIVIVLSIFNGMELSILEMYNSFDPHIKIEQKDGKRFNSDSISRVLSIDDDIKIFSRVLEQDVSISYNESYGFARIKGVDKNYRFLNKFDNLLVHSYTQDSSLYFEDYMINGINTCNIGILLARYHRINLHKQHLINYDQKQDKYINIILPRRYEKQLKDTSDFIFKKFLPVGTFASQKDYDSKYIICSLSAIQDILNVKTEDYISSIELMLYDESKINEVKNRIKSKIGNNYIVKNRLEQHDFLYKLLNSERLFIYIILVFILIIATFNVITSITMSIFQKKLDIKTFSHLGSNFYQIQNIFVKQGLLQVIVGSIIGLSLGCIFYLVQKKIGILVMNGHQKYYPVDLHIIDVIAVEAIVIFIGVISVYFPSRFLVKRLLKSN